MSTPSLDLVVHCYAGYCGEETPRTFTLGQRPRLVTEVIDRWLDPKHRYFKVRADDGGIYLLCHNTRSTHWQLTLYDSGRHSDLRLSC
jgi:hypothetical protein